MQRLEALKAWLATQFPGQDVAVEFAAADADFRRYFRATLADGSTRIVMDAPPEQKNTDSFVNVRELLAPVANVPAIYARDVAQGFILLQDMGKVSYLAALLHDEREMVHQHLLMEAVDTLINIQLQCPADSLPLFDHAFLLREVNLLPEWFAAKELGKPFTYAQRKLWDEGLKALLPAIEAQPKVFMHRDFTVRNLMLTTGQPALLDFQDAVQGPLSYDLVSLLRDAFIGWDEEFVLDIAIRYWEKARAAGLPVAATVDDFYREFEWAGVQRHLKIVGLFARLAHRDGKTQYLAEIPRFTRYLKKTTRRYGELAPLFHLLADLVGLDAEDNDESIQSVFSHSRISSDE